MRVLGENKVIPDNEVIFYDGFLYIISISGEDRENVECERICLCAEYDEPLTLSDIEKRYPNVCKVIFDDALRGFVYNHGNHSIEQNNEAWEQVGTTLGYA